MFLSFLPQMMPKFNQWSKITFLLILACFAGIEVAAATSSEGSGESVDAATGSESALNFSAMAFMGSPDSSASKPTAPPPATPSPAVTPPANQAPPASKPADDKGGAAKAAPAEQEQGDFKLAQVEQVDRNWGEDQRERESLRQSADDYYQKILAMEQKSNTLIGQKEDDYENLSQELNKAYSQASGSMNQFVELGRRIEGYVQQTIARYAEPEE